MNIESIVVAGLMAAASAAQAQYHRCLPGDYYCQVLPPQGYPLPPLSAPRYAPPPVAVRPRPTPPQPQPDRRMTQDEWREAIIKEAQRFCDAFPQDQQCHFKGPQQ